MRLLLISWTPSQSFIILCLTKKTSPRQKVKMRSLFEFETLLPELSGKSCILQHLRVTCRRYVCGSLLKCNVVSCWFTEALTLRKLFTNFTGLEICKIIPKAMLV